MRRSVRSISLLLALILALGTFAFAASAEKTSSTKVWAAARKVEVHASKSLKSKVVARFYYGQSVKTANYDFRNTWTKVTGKNGNTGYVLTYKITDSNPNRYSFKLYTKKKTAIYAAPYASSRKLATRAKGKKLTAVGLTGGFKWWRVKTGSGYGYVPASACAARNYAWFTGTNIAITSNDNFLLSYAEKVDVIGEYDGYTFIYFDGGKRLGAVNSKRFSKHEPQAAGTAAYAAADGASLFREAVFSSHYKSKSLSRNAKVTILYGSDSLGFYVVRYGKHNYYMCAQTLSKEKHKGYYRLNAARNTSLYSSREFKQKYLVGILVKNQQVKLVKLGPVKAYIETSNGEKGWVYIRDLEW